MLTQVELDSIDNSEPEGKKRNIRILVTYLGGNRADRDSYQLDFSGKVATEEGHLICLGPAGNTHGTKKNRYVLRFRLSCGEGLRRVSFRNPNPPNEFVFFIGDCGDGSCPETSVMGVDDEFDGLDIDLDGDLTVINRKMNSSKNLGYRFKLWVTHSDGAVHPIDIDPRIINK